MALIKRLDHMILCARDRKEWVPLIESVLGLRVGRSREGDEWGFSNAEFNIGDGFLGLVEPTGEDSPLDRFLQKFQEGFYAVSVDVGNLTDAAEFLDNQQVRYRKARRDGHVALLWLPASVTGGVVYQLTAPVPLAQGANLEYMGFSRVVVAVDDLDSALTAYRRCFGLEQTSEIVSAQLGFAGADLAITESTGRDSMVLAVPTNSSGPFASRSSSAGLVIFQFTIDVRDLDAELRRLADNEVAVVTDDRESPTLAWIDPHALHGVRVELRQAS
jgi:catechol 2,3-dioxygenase-like lactoylglutathione lyase family enzyme